MRTLPRPSQRIQLDVSLAIVNIVLLLILFFLATGQLLNPPAQDVELAETSDLALDELPAPILIVDSEGRWELDGAEVAPDLLGTAIAEFPSDVILHVMINRDAPASTLMEVLAQPDLADTQMRLVTLRRMERAP